MTGPCSIKDALRRNRTLYIRLFLINAIGQAVLVKKQYDTFVSLLFVALVLSAGMYEVERRRQFERMITPEMRMAGARVLAAIKAVRAKPHAGRSNPRVRARAIIVSAMKNGSLQKTLNNRRAGALVKNDLQMFRDVILRDNPTFEVNFERNGRLTTNTVTGEELLTNDRLFTEVAIGTLTKPLSTSDEIVTKPLPPSDKIVKSFGLLLGNSPCVSVGRSTNARGTNERGKAVLRHKSVAGGFNRRNNKAVSRRSKVIREQTKKK